MERSALEMKYLIRSATQAINGQKATTGHAGRIFHLSSISITLHAPLRSISKVLLRKLGTVDLHHFARPRCGFSSSLALERSVLVSSHYSCCFMQMYHLMHAWQGAVGVICSFWRRLLLRLAAHRRGLVGWTCIRIEITRWMHHL